MIRPLLKKVFGPIFYRTPLLYGAYHKLRGISAATLSGFPSTKMTVIGITGTNGKTTTANLLAHILEASGARVGLATTVNIWTGQKKWVNETKMTTLSPFGLQGLLRQMVKQKCQYAIVETTSHSLAQHRTWGIFYDVAVFTNITHDHLDYHPNFEHYRSSKSKLFSDLSASLRKPNMPKIAVINLDDPEHPHFGQFDADKKYYFAIDNISTTPAPDQLVSASNVQLSARGVSFTLTAPTGTAEIQLKIPGRFNVHNALAAVSAALGLGVDLATIKRGLESMWGVPGRMEHVSTNRDFSVIIDYAHTPDGFTKVLETLRPVVNGRIIAVFGSAGDRDKTKRPILGQIASQFADYIVLTEEDPAHENPSDIINDILPGIDTDKFHKDHNLHIIVDRKKAIQHAIHEAKANDLVLLLSIGAQTKMVRGNKLVPYSEKTTVEETLQTLV